MSQIDPFIGSAIQATGVQRAQAAEKDRHLQRAQDLKKNAGLSGDRFEHAVESAEEIDPTHDEQKQNPNKKREPRKRAPRDDSQDDQEPRLDLTA
jgi:hypothetical protein